MILKPGKTSSMSLLPNLFKPKKTLGQRKPFCSSNRFHAFIQFFSYRRIYRSNEKNNPFNYIIDSPQKISGFLQDLAGKSIRKHRLYMNLPFSITVFEGFNPPCLLPFFVSVPTLLLKSLYRYSPNQNPIHPAGVDRAFTWCCHWPFGRRLVLLVTIRFGLGRRVNVHRMNCGRLWPGCPWRMRWRFKGQKAKSTMDW